MTASERIHITDLADPRLAPYRGLRDAHLARKDPADPDRPGGLFIAEGHAVARTLLESRFETVSVLASERRAHLIEDDIPPGVPFFVLPDVAINDVVGFDIHRGVLAAGRRVPEPALAELADGASTIVALEGLSNHDNVGSIFRLAAALAGPSPRLLLDATCCDPLYRKSLRVSMGHALRVPFARTSNLPAAIGQLRAASFYAVALESCRRSMPLSELNRNNSPRVLVVGAEGPGLAEATLAAVNQVAEIPMNPGVPSLNVATAAAIALYHFQA